MLRQARLVWLLNDLPTYIRVQVSIRPDAALLYFLWEFHEHCHHLDFVRMIVALVDPSRTVQKAVTQLLAARGHQVRAFADGLEALAQLRSDPTIDALVTSAEPLGISGVELCWQARLLANSRGPIYIIMMSSNSDLHRVCEALDAGADDYIGKPPVAEELYARMRAAERLAALQRELVRLATTDPLTGLLNRRAFFEHAVAACTHADAAYALSAIMIDIDHFKSVNDRYGHAVGDDAIRSIAHELAGGHAIVGRLGGEEFVTLMNCGLAQAEQAAQDLRSRIAGRRLETEQGTLTLTCSFGVAEWRIGDTIDELLKRADAALYAAKSSGRNCVVASTNVAPASSDGRGSIIRTSARQNVT